MTAFCPIDLCMVSTQVHAYIFLSLSLSLSLYIYIYTQIYLSEGFALTGYVVPGCWEDGAWMLWEDSPVVAIVEVFAGWGWGEEAWEGEFEGAKPIDIFEIIILLRILQIVTNCIILYHISDSYQLHSISDDYTFKHMSHNHKLKHISENLTFNHISDNYNFKRPSDNYPINHFSDNYTFSHPAHDKAFTINTDMSYHQSAILDANLLSLIMI